jgi:predicted Zn-dependent peptidase
MGISSWKTSISNIRIYHDHLPDPLSTSIHIFVNVGSQDEMDTQYEGMSHLLEHMLFKGSKKFPNAMAISSALDEVGGDINAYTDRDLTCYHIKCSSSARIVKSCLSVLSDMLVHPILDEMEFEKEKKIVIEELQRQKENPVHSADEITIFENYKNLDPSFARTVGGSAKCIDSLHYSDFIHFFKRYYALNSQGIVIVIASPCSLRILRGMISASSLNTDLPPPPHEYNDDTSTFHTMSSFPISSRLDWDWSVTRVNGLLKEGSLLSRFASIFTPRGREKHSYIRVIVDLPMECQETYAKTPYNNYDIFCVMLGGNMSSRLFQVLRVKSALVYGISARQFYFRFRRFLLIQTSCDENNTEKVIAILESELKQTLFTEQPSDKEWKRASAYLHGMYMVEKSSSEERANKIGQSVLRFPFVPRTSTPSVSLKTNDWHSIIKTLQSCQFRCFVIQH